jgi:hypothetical protein
MKTRFVRIACLALVIAGCAAVVSAQGHRSCSTYSLVGDWAYTETGSVVAPTGTILSSAVGKYTFKRDGTFTGVQFSSTGGAVKEDVKQGTFEIGEDCTATLTLTVQDQAGNVLRNSVWAVVIAADGSEVHGIMKSLVLPNGLALGPIMTLRATRVSDAGPWRGQR